MSQASREVNPAVVAGIAVAALVLGGVVFWPGSPKGVTEWTPADHDQPVGQTGQVAQPPRAPHLPASNGATSLQDGAELAELAWAKSCTACHGQRGRGDGPQGAMIRAPDLTRADWQGRVTDDEIRQTIRNGRNNMPKFDLPPGVVDGLVRRIRANRAR